MSDTASPIRPPRARGRPPVADALRRRPFGIRLSPAELADAQERARAAGLELSAYVRQAVVGAQIRAPGHVAARQWRELAPLQANLNQVAHRLNSGGSFDDADRDLLERLETQVRAIRLALMDAS